MFPLRLNSMTLLISHLYKSLNGLHIVYTKTDLVFGFSKNQILVAVILGQNCFWIFPKTILR